MKIEKHGKVYYKESEKTEKFKCDNCGCEFTAKEDEYYIDYNGANYTPINTISTYTISLIAKDIYVCSCPECSKIVKKIHERKTDSNWITATSTYLDTNKRDSITVSDSTSDVKVTIEGACK